MSSNLKEFACVKNWLMGLRPYTVAIYLRYFPEFCEFSGLNPDEFLQKAEKSRREAHDLAKKFYLHLASQGLHSGSRYQAYGAVRSFLAHNDVPLGRRPPAFDRRVEFEPGRLLEAREIFDMIGCAHTVRNRAVISFLAQSGQRVGLIVALRYGHLRKQLEEGVKPIVVEISEGLADSRGQSANKAGTAYRFAIGRESASYLDHMIRQRRLAGETIDDESWLFRHVAKHVVTPEGKRVPRRVGLYERGGPLTPEGIYFIVHQAATNAGIHVTRQIGRSRRGFPVVINEVHPHIFRRWWKHSMRSGGARDSDLLDFMLGHSLGWNRTYDSFDPEFVRREYAKAEPFLSVSSQINKRPSEVGVVQPLVHPDRQVSTHKAVDEAELNTHFAGGWRYLATLPSGKVVVESSSRVT